MAETTVPDEGPVQSTSVAEVLETLAAGHRTGLVRFHGADPRIVALAEGRLYLATSGSGPSIHQIVVGSGAAPEAAWADAGAGPAGGEGIAAVLDEDGRVDSIRLRDVLYEHAVATLAELLVPGTSDRYEFLADQTHQLGRRFAFSVGDALVEAGRRLGTWRAISAILPSTATRVRPSPTLAPGTATVELTAVEWQVLAALPTETTVAETIEGSGLSAFTVFDVLHGLVRRGLVQAVDAAPS